MDSLDIFHKTCMFAYRKIYFKKFFIFHSTMKFNRVVIFEQPFDTTFGDNFFFLSFHWLKTMERKRKRENKRIM